MVDVSGLQWCRRAVHAWTSYYAGAAGASGSTATGTA
jgi:hypothetical protein